MWRTFRIVLLKKDTFSSIRKRGDAFGLLRAEKQGLVCRGGWSTVNPRALFHAAFDDEDDMSDVDEDIRFGGSGITVVTFD